MSDKHHDAPGESQDALRHQEDQEHHPFEHEGDSPDEGGHEHHDHDHHVHVDRYAAEAAEGE